MAIVGDAAWESQVSAEFKTPLYSLEILSFQGTVSTSGFNVTRLSGNPFLGTWPGKTILLGGGAYVVNVVTNANLLSVTRSVGTNANITYGFPLLILGTFLSAGDPLYQIPPILNGPANLLPTMDLPSGAGQSVSEIDGHSSISNLSVQTIDPNGTVKAAVATGVIGLVAVLKVGFPGLDYSEFIALHTGTIIDTGYTASGIVTFDIADNQKQLVSQIWLNGGPGHQGTVNTGIGAPAWAANTTYPLYSLIKDTNNHYQLAISAGISASSPPAVWNSSGGTTNDGLTLIWQDEGIADRTCQLATGNLFVTDGSWNGGTVYLGSPGTAYIVAFVITQTLMLLGTSAGSQSGIQYVMPDDNEPLYFSTKDDGYALSANNPRYLYAHPLDILLCAMQNELGIGQDPSLPPPLELLDDGTGGSMEAVFAPNAAWIFYRPTIDPWQASTNYILGALILDPAGHYQKVTVAGTSGGSAPSWNDAGGTTADNTITWADQGTANPTLINPNPYIDVPGVLALRDNEFAAERMFFRITRAENGKTWVEDQILKPLGLYWISRASGVLSLKSMKRPLTITPVVVNQDSIMDIPEISRYPIINYIIVRSQVKNQNRATAAREYDFDQTYVQSTSINTYKQQFQNSIESDGLISALGSSPRAALTVNRVFNRHAFGTPEYKLISQFRTLTLELGDFISLSHPALFDSKLGVLGMTNVTCEVVDRQPDFAGGRMEYHVLDTRFINLPAKAYEVAPVSTPVWTSSSPTQKSTFSYIAGDNGLYSDSTPGNTIF